MSMSHASPRWIITVALLTVAAVIIPIGASANHGGDQILVGIRQIDGDPGRNQYDVFDKSVFAGTTVEFVFDNGFHNVVWVAGNPAALPDSPGAPGGDAVGSTFQVAPTTPGTYLYFCSIHASATDAQTEDWAAANLAGETARMVGRIVVQADTTAPVWGTGTASATAISASQIDLSWPTATDDSGSVSYEIYEATGATQPAKPALPVDTVVGTSTSRTGLTAGEHYWYWITAVDGTGNAATPDQQADATTSSVAASATASGVVQFSVNPSLAISVSPPLLDLGTLNPAAPGSGAATVTVQSNDTWSLNLKSIGRDGIAGGADDGVFTDDSGRTIPVARATWDAGTGATALSDVDAVVLTGQAATASTSFPVTFAVQLQFDDPAGTNYQTVVLYTVTQP